MADNVTVDNADLTDYIAATDEISSVHYQQVKIVDGTLGSTTAWVVHATDGGRTWLGNVSITSTSSARSLGVVLRDTTGADLQFPAPVVSRATPTLPTSALTDGKSMDTTIVSFASVVTAPGLTGHILKWMVYDDSNMGANVDLWLFDSSVTPATEGTTHSISDADMDNCVGVLRGSDGYWSAGGANQVFTGRLLPPLPFNLASGTTLYGIPVSRASTVTYAANSLEIALHVQPD